MRRKSLSREKYKASLTWARDLVDEHFEYREAVKAYSDLMKCRPKDPLLSFERGLTYRLLHESRRALADVNRALRLGYSGHEAYQFRASVYSTLGNHAAAVQDYSKVIRIGLTKDLDEYHFSRAKEHLKLGNLGAALADLDQAIMLRPDNLAYYRSRAAVRRRRWDLSGAILDYTRAINLCPRNAGNYLDRARVFELRGDLLSALEDLATARKLAPCEAPIGDAYRDVHRRLQARLRRAC